jgi:hypothetical protein
MISIPTDKIFHGLAGAAVAGACHPFGITIALAAVAVVAIGKEVYDHFAGGTVDPWDAMATGWGGAVMVGWLELAQAYA